MRTLTRPMFNMGGPIKQGVMHGIREPYKGGGKAALVGNPVYPKTGGREHHAVALGAGLARLAPLAARTFANIGRGLKTGRMYTPSTEKLGFRKRLADLLLPSGRFRNVAGKKATDPSSAYMNGDFTASAGSPAVPGSRMGLWEALTTPKRLGAAIRENPFTTFGVASTIPQTGFLAGKIAAAAPGKIWDTTKRYAAGVLPGDQSSWYTPEEPPKGIEKPGGYSKATVTGKGLDKPLTKAQQEKWADAQRGKRLDNLLDIMGYDRSKKTAIADALIDASKIVSDRGTLDRKNITGELINPIIQATSKRLDKPEQIREAVGLMMAKGEIEKDLYKWKPGTALKNAQDMAETLGITVEEAMRRQSKMSTNVGEEIMGWGVTKKSAPTESEIEQITRNYANANNIDFKEIISTDKLKEGGLQETDTIEIVSGLLTGDAGKDDGFYQVGKDVIKVTNGVPKKHYGG